MNLLKRLILALVTVAFIGCGHSMDALKEDHTAPTGTAINQADAHADSARAAVKAAVPHSDGEGRVSLTSADRELVAVKAKLAEANASNDAEHAARVKAQAELDASAGREAALERSWGHKLQVWSTLLFWTLISLYAAHVLLGLLGLWITGPAGAVLAAGSTIINPLSWFAVLREMHWNSSARPAVAGSP